MDFKDELQKVQMSRTEKYAKQQFDNRNRPQREAQAMAQQLCEECKKAAIAGEYCIYTYVSSSSGDVKYALIQELEKKEYGFHHITVKNPHHDDFRGEYNYWVGVT